MPSVFMGDSALHNRKKETNIGCNSIRSTVLSPLTKEGITMKKIGLIFLGALISGHAMAVDCSSGIPVFKPALEACDGVAEPGSGGGVGGDLAELIALDDNFTVVPNVTNSISGNVTLNDSNVLGGGIFEDFPLDSGTVTLKSSPVSEYGYLQFNSNGDFIYTLYDKAESVTNLQVGDVVTDRFTYTLNAGSGETSSARLAITIIGNPVDPDGNTVLPQQEGQVYDFADVDIEFNDSAAQATALTSARMIKGHMHDGNDRDWYILPSNGNEIISLEVCPQGSSCYNKKRWVLYVFDADWFTPDMAGTLPFSRWVDETGTTRDLLGNQIISGVSSAGSSDHLYLAYRAGMFDGALIGIVDPCFDTSNKVDIGVPNQAKNYLIAISNPLNGDADGAGDVPGESAVCGQGSVVLKRAGFNAAGQTQDADGNIFPKSYSTTEEYISVYHSDDQYTIRVTGTGLHPLLSEQAQARAATYNAKTGEFVLPRVRVEDRVIAATAQENPIEPRSGEGSLDFILSEIVELDIDELADAYQAIYNPENGQVLIPVVTEVNSGDSYSVICQYHPATDAHEAWLEVLSAELIE